MRRPPLSPKLAGFGTTIFAEMSALAAATGAINLGQGFPDEDGPAEVADAAVAAIRGGANQYPPGPGIPELRVAIAEHQARFWGIEVDPATEVLVTAGATEAIAAAVLALCDPGDEILAFEPTYDSYGAVAAMAGARLRAVTLVPPAHEAEVDTLAALVSDRTRLVLLNSPHNPTGKVFTTDELAAIARLCVDRDLIAVTDEVYEHLVFDGTHQPLATFPGMAERTITISSAGKTFSFTGWKVGWACGPEELVTAVRTAKQFLTYVNGAPFQPAVAVGLALDDAFYASLSTTLEAKRDLLCDGLRAAGFEVFVPQGTYFATVDIRSVGGTDGLELCRSLPARCGVVAIPSSVFYQDPSTGQHLVRFAFCKRIEVLTEAAERLAKLADLMTAALAPTSMSHPVEMMGGMDLWRPPDDQPPLLEWWAPLVLAASAARRERVPWPIHLDEFTLMGRVDRGTRPAVWTYKHRESLHELYLDDTGQAYKFTRTPRATAYGRFTPCDIRTAIYRAELPTFVEAVWYDEPPPYPSPGADWLPDDPAIAPATPPSGGGDRRRRRPRRLNARRGHLTLIQGGRSRAG